MNFGKVEFPEKVDFSLLEDNPLTTKILSLSKKDELNIYVGCAKWNRQDLKGFYPRGTKDELAYYSTRFNSIELNATFYKMPTASQVVKWKDKTPENFKFFPKITQSISHYNRLRNVQELTQIYCDAVAHFEEKLGMCFLQLRDDYSPKDWELLRKFILDFPKVIPLAVEVRNEQWFEDKKMWNEYSEFLSENNVTNVIVDTAGRRDMMHMTLTTDAAFIRFVGCNIDTIDHQRLNEWGERIKKWKTEGLKNLYFFVHQNIEVSSPLLSNYFLENSLKDI